MKIIIHKYQNLTLRTKLSISFIILISLSLTLLGFGYYYKTSGVILNNAGETILGLVKQTNRSLDIRFSMIEKSAINMHLDEDLFDFFKEVPPNRTNFSNEEDKKITRILQKYFPNSPGMYSVNLLSNKYMFGGNPYFWMPKTDFADTQVYQIGLQATDGTRWIPTYNLLNMFYSSEKVAENETQSVFTATRLINVSLIKNNILHHLPKDYHRPVLVINFQEEMIKHAFSESVQPEGSYYYVLTREGRVISNSDKEEVLPSDTEAWIQENFPKESGTGYIQLNGIKTLYAYDTIRETDWISVVFIPYTELVEMVPDMFSYTVMITVVVILFAIAVASYISGKISYPLKQLLVGMRKIGEGNFESRIDIKGKGEIQYLIYKFNDMNGRIKNLIDENYNVKIEKMEADLRALNFQFNPHFLYNTLNIMNYLAIENKQNAISEMLVELSEMLEYTAKYQNDKVPFGEDLHYLENYLSIMKKRFVEKFTIYCYFDPAFHRYSVPKFFLQPFVENAMIHGFEDRDEGGKIEITGFIQDGIRHFVIQDNGIGMMPETIERCLSVKTNEESNKIESIGIDNVNKRIKLLYGEAFGVCIQSEPMIGTKVMITLPAA